MYIRGAYDTYLAKIFPNLNLSQPQTFQSLCYYFLLFYVLKDTFLYIWLRHLIFFATTMATPWTSILAIPIYNGITLYESC